MMLLLSTWIIVSSGLKLLESSESLDTPTTPYKPSGTKETSQAVCTTMEMWDAPELDFKVDDASAAVEIFVSPNTACAKTIEAEGKKLMKFLSTNPSAAATNDATADFGVILDRCCQTPWDMADAAISFAGQKNVGFGKPRLPGLSPLCKGWTWNIDDVTAEHPPIQFWSTMPTLTGCSADPDWLCVAHHKSAAAAAPAAGTGVITPKTGTKLADAIAPACPAGAGKTLDCLIALRKQCMSGEFDAAQANSWQAMDPYPTVCGGFCSPLNSNEATFYKTYYCYLDMGGGTDANARCYSTKSPTPNPGQMPQAFNDPKVVNMAGERFEILATGTFSMLGIEEAAKENLKILATIDRAGSRCGATYIQNISLTGDWVSKLGMSEVSIRANAAVPKKSALQISTNQAQTWLQYSDWHKVQNISSESPQAVTLRLNSIMVEVSVDAHRVVEGGRKTRRFANFLNLNVKGVQQLSHSFKVSGLLGTDDHGDAMALPQECEKEVLAFRTLSRAGVNSVEHRVDMEGDGDVKVDEEEQNPSGCPLEECGAPLPETK